MSRRNNITCTACEETIGSYPVFSHANDEQDTGDAEYNENYGGKIEGDDYCFDCYHAILNKNDDDLLEKAI
jgi:hypothetical protein